MGRRRRLRSSSPRTGSRVPGSERRRRGRNKRGGDRARRRVKIRKGAPVVTVQVTAAHNGVQASRLRGLPQVKRKCLYIVQAPPRYLGEPTGKGWRQQGNLKFQVRFQQARPLWRIKVSSRLACNPPLPKKNTRRKNTSIRRKRRKRKRKRRNGRRKMEAKPGVRRRGRAVAEITRNTRRT